MEENLESNTTPQISETSSSLPESSKGKTKKFAKFLFPLIILALLVGGYFALAKTQNWWPFKVSDKQQETSDQENPALSGVEGWQTYRNEEFGFEVRYPNDWKEEGGFLYSREMYNAREGGPYSLLISTLSKIKESPSQECIKDFEKYNINNIPAERYTDICSFGKPTYVVIKIREKNILGTSYSFNKSENIIINQILSTFKFIEPDSSNPITTPNTISWEEALDFIRSCKVSTIFQYHDLRANLNLVDGRKVSTIQPQIDLVIPEAQSASRKCGYTIPIATE